MQPLPPPPGMPPPQIVYVYPAPPPKSSLLWLWIVLGVLGGIVVIGILAAVAIPSFMSYQQKAKRSEAEINLGWIEKSARRYAQETSSFPQGEVGQRMEHSCCDAGTSDRRCPADPGEWMDPVWQELEFSVDEPRYFQYSYRGTIDGFVATAVGDLDCDGTMVTYTLEGTMIDGNPIITLTRPDRPD